MYYFHTAVWKYKKIVIKIFNFFGTSNFFLHMYHFAYTKIKNIKNGFLFTVPTQNLFLSRARGFVIFNKYPYIFTQISLHVGGITYISNYTLDPWRTDVSLTWECMQCQWKLYIGQTQVSIGSPSKMCWNNNPERWWGIKLIAIQMYFTKNVHM